MTTSSMKKIYTLNLYSAHVYREANLANSYRGYILPTANQTIQPMRSKAEQGVPPLRAASGARVNADVRGNMKDIPT